MEMAFAHATQAEPQMLDAYQRASNTLRRLLQSVGLKRVARDVTPDLATYLETKAQ